MANTGLDIFNHSIQKTNEVLIGVQDRLGWENRHLVFEVLKNTLHHLRDRLPVDENVNFADQLPMVLKGVYFEGWDPSNAPIKETKDDFVNDIDIKYGYMVENDTEEIIKIVFDEIFKSIGLKESNKLKKVLPEDWRELF